MLRTLVILFLAIAGIVAIFYFVLRPWSHRRGATDAEVTRSLPGDDLVPVLKVGDSIKIFEQAPFTVMAVEPARSLVLLARVDTDTSEYFELSDEMPANYLNNGWGFFLEEIDEATTRLIVRWRGDYSPGLGTMLGIAIPTDAGALLMQPKMLKGIKERAERGEE